MSRVDHQAPDPCEVREAVYTAVERIRQRFTEGTDNVEADLAVLKITRDEAERRKSL